ncbi:MAG: class I SAM-dependent methyltransferase [Planctomycetota bacterium]|nr:class I SAM-dependent methyltransferase [Planctomycetota bacterium]MEC8510556.1 class I SAM-dependent methyltransferase [Planctomycetota bacterium]
MGWTERREGWRDEEVAAAYDARRFRTPLQRAKHANDARIVGRLLGRVGAGLRVLDAPTGTGRMVPELLAEGHRVVGIDLSTAMLSRASDGDEVSGFVGHAAGEIERLPFADDAFDAAISLRFLFHAKDRAVRIGLYRELARVAPALVGHVRARGTLKHGGRWLRSRVGAAKRYRPAPTRAITAAELAQAGWKLVEYVPVSRAFSDKALFLARRA